MPGIIDGRDTGEKIRIRSLFSWGLHLNGGNRQTDE